MVLRVITIGRNNGTTCDNDRSKQWYYMWSRQVESVVLSVITTDRNNGTTCDHDRLKQLYYVWSRQVETMALRVITTGRKNGTTCDYDRSKKFYYAWSRQVEIPDIEVPRTQVVGITRECCYLRELDELYLVKMHTVIALQDYYLSTLLSSFAHTRKC